MKTSFSVSAGERGVLKILEDRRREDDVVVAL